MIEFRDKFPGNRKWRVLDVMLTIDELDPDYEHKVNGVIYSTITEEFKEAFEKEQFWMQVKGEITRKY